MKNNLYIAALNIKIMAQTTAITHKDVKGKELYYLKVSNGSNEVLVNVGKSTYDKVRELDKQQELPLNSKENECSKVGHKKDK